MTNEITSEPTAAAPPVYEIIPDPKHDELEDTAAKIPSLNSIYNKFFTKDGWLGDYDYAFLCMPTIPCLGKKSSRQPPFFGLKTKLPVLLAIVMGMPSPSCFSALLFFFSKDHSSLLSLQLY
jgi:NCS2 family nucleobase:cation symporter-2